MIGGKRPGAGRKKGSQTKKTAAIKARVAELLKTNEVLPLEFLLALMREPAPKQQPNEDSVVFCARYGRWLDQRFEAAKAAAPYVHPKLANIEHSGPDGGPIKHTLQVEFVSPPTR